MKLKSIIVEDELGAQKTLLGLIQLYCPVFEVVAQSTNLVEAKEHIEKYQPDVVLLDMEVKGQSGLNLLDQFDSFPFEVIITTAYARFALPSYDYDVADFLMKPISPSHLKRAVGRVLERYFLKNQENVAEPPVLVALPLSHDWKNVEINAIVRLAGSRNYTWIYFTDRPAILVSKTMAVLEKLLEHHGFLRIHHSHLVNKVHINHWHKRKNQIELKDGDCLPVSRAKREIVETWFSTGKGSEDKSMPMDNSNMPMDN